MADLEIDDKLSLPEGELSFRTSRSSGPGGQNVNKVETRVTLEFDLDASPSLEEGQRQRLRERLGNRINRSGLLQVHADEHRTQAANRRAAIDRFVALLREALRPETPRRPTRPSRAAVERRLEEKKRRGRRKSERGGDWQP